jgi:hypothetical protein
MCRRSDVVVPVLDRPYVKVDAGIGRPSMFFAIMGLLALSSGLVCRQLAARRGLSPAAWMIWGLSFGPIPVAILLFVPRRSAGA